MSYGGELKSPLRDSRGLALGHRSPLSRTSYARPLSASFTPSAGVGHRSPAAALTHRSPAGASIGVARRDPLDDILDESTELTLQSAQMAAKLAAEKRKTSSIELTLLETQSQLETTRAREGHLVTENAKLKAKIAELSTQLGTMEVHSEEVRRRELALAHQTNDWKSTASQYSVKLAAEERTKRELEESLRLRSLHTDEREAVLVSQLSMMRDKVADMERQLDDARKRDAAAKIEANELRANLSQRERDLASQAALCKDLSSVLEKRKLMINDLSSQINDEQKKRSDTSLMMETRSRRVIEVETELDQAVKRERLLIVELAEEKKQRAEMSDRLSDRNRRLGGLEESRGEQAIALDQAQNIIRRLEAKVAEAESSERRLTDITAQFKARVLELEGRLGDSERGREGLAGKAAEFAECMTALAELHVHTSSLWRDASPARRQWLLALQDKISGRLLKDQIAELQRERTRIEADLLLIMQREKELVEELKLANDKLAKSSNGKAGLKKQIEELKEQLLEQIEYRQAFQNKLENKDSSSSAGGSGGEPLSKELRRKIKLLRTQLTQERRERLELEQKFNRCHLPHHHTLGHCTCQLKREKRVQPLITERSAD